MEEKEDGYEISFFFFGNSCIRKIWRIIEIIVFFYSLHFHNITNSTKISRNILFFQIHLLQYIQYQAPSTIIRKFTQVKYFFPTWKIRNQDWKKKKKSRRWFQWAYQRVPETNQQNDQRIKCAIRLWTITDNTIIKRIISVCTVTVVFVWLDVRVQSVQGW